jgi:hypothetical protein
MPEDHSCSVDYHIIGKDQLEKANPAIKGEKLVRI